MQVAILCIQVDGRVQISAHNRRIGAMSKALEYIEAEDLRAVSENYSSNSEALAQEETTAYIIEDMTIVRITINEKEVEQYHEEI